MNSMRKKNCTHKASSIFLYALLWISLDVFGSTPQQTYTGQTQPNTTQEPDDQESDQDTENSERTIHAIIIKGNKYVTKEAILNLIPFKVGETFDAKKTSQIIKNLYYGLNRFQNVYVYQHSIDNDQLDLIIVVQEKKLLKDVEFIGNKNLAEKDITSKIPFDEIASMDEAELKKYAQEIKKLYLDKGYYKVKIDTKLPVDGDQAVAVFSIEENSQASVKRILFTGNNAVAAKELRNIIFTREDWILSFMDKSGTYIPDRLEADKQVLEQFYQNKGYLSAKVIDIITDIDDKANVTLTFDIQEGNLYTIDQIKAPVPEGQTIPEEFLISQLPMRPGQPYSRDAIVESIKRLEQIWGNQGYIFTNIDPSIQPDEDKKTVSITFYSELGNKVFLNRLTIKGNKKTHDKIIRRRLLLEEGELLTQFKMDASKDRVEGLGFFDPKDGVTWKLSRINPETADLDLILKEAKTGHFNIKLGWGGLDMSSPANGLSLGAELADTNLFGSGISVNAQANFAKEENSFAIHLAQPWLFDKPISGAVDVYHKRPGYDEFRFAMPIYEKSTGGAVTGGFISRTQWWNDTQFLCTFGIDDVRYQNREANENQENQAVLNNVAQPLKALLPVGNPDREAYQAILNREFTPSTYFWFANAIEQDERNHPMHPSRGHKFKLLSKFAIPGILNTALAYYKFDMDYLWFTPLINEYDLVLKLHGHVGIVTPLARKNIPFNELYHVGGPTSVRGYLFGQIGPKFLGDAFGSKKALYINAELIFPVTADFNIKGVFFYDGGAGWDNPNACCVEPGRFVDNTFTYRHSIGVGFRMLNPMPVKVDWGFKLDPRRNRFDPKRSESASEIHFGMSYDW